MGPLQFWFDYSCPYAYLASERIEALAARHGATVSWQPMLLGAVLRARTGVADLRPTLSVDKARYLLSDQLRVASFQGLPLHPPAAHPRRTVNALRATLARGSDPALIHAFYRAYWVEGQAIEDPEVVRRIAGDLDLEAWREPLRAQTDRALARGVFGAPTIFVDEQRFFGQDRLHFVEAALEARHAA